MASNGTNPGTKCRWHSRITVQWMCNGKMLLIIIVTGEIAGLYFPLQICTSVSARYSRRLRWLFLSGKNLDLNLGITSPPPPRPPPPPFMLGTNLGRRGDGYLNAKWCCNSTQRGGVNEHWGPEIERGLGGAGVKKNAEGWKNQSGGKQRAK